MKTRSSFRATCSPSSHTLSPRSWTSTCYNYAHSPPSGSNGLCKNKDCLASHSAQLISLLIPNKVLSSFIPSSWSCVLWRRLQKPICSDTLSKDLKICLYRFPLSQIPISRTQKVMLSETQDMDPKATQRAGEQIHGTPNYMKDG